MHSIFEPGYDTGVSNTSSIASDIVVPINSPLFTVTSHSSYIKAPVYNDTKYSVYVMTL